MNPLQRMIKNNDREREIDIEQRFQFRKLPVYHKDTNTAQRNHPSLNGDLQIKNIELSLFQSKIDLKLHRNFSKSVETFKKADKFKGIKNRPNTPEFDSKMEKLNINTRNIESHRELMEELKDTQRDNVLMQESKIEDLKENTNISIREEDENIFGMYGSIDEQNALVNPCFDANSRAATHLQKNSLFQESEPTPLAKKVDKVTWLNKSIKEESRDSLNNFDFNNSEVNGNNEEEKDEFKNSFSQNADLKFPELPSLRLRMTPNEDDNSNKSHDHENLVLEEATPVLNK